MYNANTYFYYVHLDIDLLPVADPGISKPGGAVPAR